MSQEAADLFTRLAPVLNVRDLAAERAFYQSLGLPVIYEGPEYRSSSGSEPRRCISASRKRQPNKNRGPVPDRCFWGAVRYRSRRVMRPAGMCMTVLVAAVP